MVERVFDVDEATGSSPVPRTKLKINLNKMGTIMEGILNSSEYSEKVLKLRELVERKNEKEAALIEYLKSGNPKSDKLEELVGEIRSNEMFIDEF